MTHPQRSQEEAEAEAPISSWADRHLPLIATSLAFLLVAVKAALVSRLQTGTALALVQTTGPVGIFVGAIVTNLTAFVLLLVIATSVWALWGEFRVKVWVLFFAAQVVAFAVVPWPYYAGAFLALWPLLGGVRAIILHRRIRGLKAAKEELTQLDHEREEIRGRVADLKRRSQKAEASYGPEELAAVQLGGSRPDLEDILTETQQLEEQTDRWYERSTTLRDTLLAQKRNRWAQAGVYLLGLIPSIVGPVFLVNADMWLPKETISVKQGHARVGYVLETAEGWTTILQDADRSIVRLRPEDIQARQVCGDIAPTIPSMYKLIEDWARARRNEKPIKVARVMKCDEQMNHATGKA